MLHHTVFADFRLCGHGPFTDHAVPMTLAAWELPHVLVDPFLTRKDRSPDAEWKTNEEGVLRIIDGAHIFPGAHPRRPYRRYPIHGQAPGKTHFLCSKP
jgi:hypothetical protein